MNKLQIDKFIIDRPDIYINFTNGYSKIILAKSVLVAKGTILILRTNRAGSIALNRDSVYSDFYLIGNKTLMPLDYSNSYAFYINVIIGDNYTYGILNLVNSFKFTEAEKTFYIKGRYSNDTLTKYFTLSNSKLNIIGKYYYFLILN